MAIDLEKLMKLDMSYPGISFGYHSWALGAYLDSLENFIDIAKEQYRVRANHELEKRKDEYCGEEYAQKQNEIDEAADQHIPRYARMSAIVPLWGIFELTITDITIYVAKKEHAKLSLKDIRANDIIEKIQKYYSGVLGLSLPWADEDIVRLRIFYRVRNAIAHRNGQFQDESPKKREEFRRIVEGVQGISFSGRELDITAGYLQSSANLIFALLESINQLACDRYEELEALSKNA